jgi:hypothetical protein
MIDYTRLERFMCSDCGHDVRALREQYMLIDDVWTAACHAVRDVFVTMLCVLCVERRLCTMLKPWMFTPCPLNTDWNNYPKSLRLRKRMTTG